MKFLIFALVLNSVSAFAATTDDLKLKGKVNEKLSIKVTAEALATDLDLEADTTAAKVAVVTEKSNAVGGYKVTITSAHLGNLEHTTATTPGFPYTLIYDGSTVDLSTAAGDEFSFPTAGVTDVDKDVKISYTGVEAELMLAGVYKDTVTFTIAAN